MPLTAEQLAIRKTRISASEVAVLLGLSPWKTPAALWVEKTQDVDPLEENEAMSIGNDFESPLIDWCAKSLGVLPDRELGTVIHPTLPWLCATPDAGIAGQKRGIEAKTAGVVRGFVESEKWGDADTDEVPVEYWCQCQIQMAVMDWNAVYLAALVAGRGRVRYLIQRDQAAIEGMIERAGAWHAKHIIGGERPTDSVPDVETLKRVRRVPNKVAIIASELGEEFDAAKAALKLAEERAEQAKAALLYAAGDADGIQSGLRQYTYFTQSRKGIDMELLRREWPHAAEACAKVSTFPVLRAKARKGQAA